MNGIKALERAALDFHRRGVGWTDFWQQHAEQVRECEPFNRARLRRLVNRLLALVASGDTAGMVAVGDDDAEPWLTDDTSTPSDSVTQTRVQWPGQATQEATR